MMSKVISMAVALVIGGAAINAGPAVAGPIGSSTILDVASPNLVLAAELERAKERVPQELLSRDEESQKGKKVKKRKVRLELLPAPIRL